MRLGLLGICSVTLCALSLALSGGCADSEAGGSCSSNLECDGGLCIGGTCRSATTDTGGAATTGTDTGGTGTVGTDTGGTGTSGADTGGPPPDTGGPTEDGGPADTGVADIPESQDTGAADIPEQQDTTPADTATDPDIAPDPDTAMDPDTMDTGAPDPDTTVQPDPDTAPEEEPLDPPVDITTTLDPCTIDGESIDVQLAATGGTSQRVWSLESGTIPDDLTFTIGEEGVDADAGRLVGTFAYTGSDGDAADEYAFTIGVVSGTSSDTRSYNVTVAPVLEVTILDETPPYLEGDGPCTDFPAVDILGDAVSGETDVTVCNKYTGAGGGRIPLGVSHSSGSCTMTGSVSELIPGDYAALMAVEGECDQVVYVPVFWHNCECPDTAPDAFYGPDDVTWDPLDADWTGLDDLGRVYDASAKGVPPTDTIYQREILVEQVDGPCELGECNAANPGDECCCVACTAGTFLASPLVVNSNLDCDSPVDADFCVEDCPVGDSGCWFDESIRFCFDWSVDFEQEFYTKRHDPVGPPGHDIGIVIYEHGRRWSFPYYGLVNFCGNDTDCVDGCDETTGRCFCGEADDCESGICDTDSGLCGCSDNDDCYTGLCDTDRGVCACNEDADCDPDDDGDADGVCEKFFGETFGYCVFDAFSCGCRDFDFDLLECDDINSTGNEWLWYCAFDTLELGDTSL